MKTDIDPIFEMAKGMNDASRSGSNYGKLMLIKDIIMGLNSMDLGVESKASIKTYLENKKTEIKKDIEKDNKFPDPFLDKM